MVIACEECQTRFHVEDARIPREGIRVRCSRCKHAFFVQPPGAGPEDLFAAAAEQGLSGEPDAAPPPTRDLGDPGNSDSGDPFGPPGGDLVASRADPAASAASSDPAAAETSTPEDDEAEWQFAIEPPEPAKDRRAPTVSGPESDPVRSVPSLGLAGPRTAEAEEPESSSLADIDNPESWNLVGADAKAPSPSVARAEPAPPPQARTVRRAEPDARASAPAHIASGARAAETRPTTAGANFIALAVVALLFAVGLQGTVRSAPTLNRPGLAAVDLGALSASRVEVRTLENAWTGPIAVVRLMAETQGGSAQPPGQMIRVVALDTAGAPLPVTAFAGRDVGDMRLREETPGRLAEVLERSAREFAQRPLSPGQPVPLVAVFPSLPANARSFSLEAVPAESATP